MTKNEAKQKVLDAVADLAQVELDTSGDYLHFLGEVEEAVSERINRLAAYEINVATGHAIPAATDDDANARAAERSEGCCGAGCWGCDRHEGE